MKLRTGSLCVSHTTHHLRNICMPKENRNYEINARKSIRKLIKNISELRCHQSALSSQ